MRHVRNIVMALIILASILLLTWIFTFFNLLMLVPWDTAVIQPEIGTWQRSLNDFFEQSTGQTSVFILSTLLIFLPVIRTLYHRWNAGLRVMIANLLATFGGYLIVLASFTVNNLIFPVSSGELDISNPFYIGYYRSIIPLFVLWMIYAVWFREIKSLAKQPEKQKSKAKNEQYNTALNRLADNDRHTETTNYQQTVAPSQHLKSQ